MKEPKEVFRGHLEECLQHFAVVFGKRWPKGAKGTDRAKKPIANFCGVGTHSVTRWIKTGILPVGMARIRFMCYLDMVGYKVLELEKIPQARRNFLELIGYSLLSIEEATKLLDYSEPSTLFQVLSGTNSPNKERTQKMWDEWMSRKDQLLSKKQEMLEVCKMSPTRKVRPVIVKKVTTQDTVKRPAVLIVMEALLVLLSEDALGKLSPQEIESLKSSTDTVLTLNAQLSAFSSHLFAKSAEVEDG